MEGGRRRAPAAMAGVQGVLGAAPAQRLGPAAAPAIPNAWGKPPGASSSPWNSAAAGSGPPRAAPVVLPSWESSVPPRADSSDDDSFSGDEDDEVGLQGGSEKRRAGVEELEGSIFGGYLQGRVHETDGKVFEAGLEKIRDQLLAGHSGATRCLICLERIKGSDPVWSCTESCYCIFHIVCIQAWARQSANAAAARAANQNLPSLAESAGEGLSTNSAGLHGSSRSAAQLAAQAALEASWHCPKCRHEYSPGDVPKVYRCFCGKQRDPEFNPWLAPHSCGETCEKKLSEGCGHKCTLLCHPGPCPPCPQLIRSSCYCGKKKDLKRCGHREFSCAKQCHGQLACGVHNCEAICHPGECPPCPKKSEYRCRCGQISEIRSCAERDFGCGRQCDAEYPCGRHQCEKICHEGPCGECPLSGKRSCPCGKSVYSDLSCDKPSPTCGRTCDKPLACGRHRCPERCHTGPCADTCRLVIAKRCRCGGLLKEVPCSQELHCERRCQRSRNCGRHICKRRCCDGACPPCAEVCGKKLRCGNHKCPAPCHSGPCAPCPLTVRISCACGSTAFTVPCGAERGQKPPKCSKRCTITQLCCHGSSCKPHRCHYGACPPCDLTCNEELPCGHRCPLICHGPKPPPNPEYTLRPQKKRQKWPAGETGVMEGRPCPPCVIPVVRPCRGRHLSSERTMPCSANPIFSCGLPCGNPLACGNHRCNRPCHDTTGGKVYEKHTFQDFVDPYIQTEAENGEGVSEEVYNTCLQCELSCKRPREPACPHPCVAPCHVAPCSPCMTLVKRSCHCGAMAHVLECTLLGKAQGADRDRLLSCNGPCHRKLQFCTHLCPQICHPGPCPDPAKCRKKVTVRCNCQRLKKEWPCLQVQAAEKERGRQGPSRGGAGGGLLPCDEECARLERERREAEELRANSPTEAKQEIVEAATGLRRRKKRTFTHAEEQRQPWLKRVPPHWLRLVAVVLVGLLLVIVFLGTSAALSRLSHWMNVRDARRSKGRPRTRHF